MKGKTKVLSIMFLVLIILGIIIHVPITRLRLQDATTTLDGYSSSTDSFIYVITLNFTSPVILYVAWSAKVTWILSGITLAENIPLQKQDNGLWITNPFYVQKDSLVKALGSSIFSGAINSTFLVTWNYYNTQSYTIQTSL